MAGDHDGITKVARTVPVRFTGRTHGANNDDGFRCTDRDVDQVGRFFQRIGSMGDHDAVHVIAIGIGACDRSDIKHEIRRDVRAGIRSVLMDDEVGQCLDSRKFCEDFATRQAGDDAAEALVECGGDGSAGEDDGNSWLHEVAKIDSRKRQFVFLLSMIKGPHHLINVATYKPGASVEEIQREYGLSNVEKLASNENPFGPSPIAVEHATKAMKTGHLYGDGGHTLREHLAALHGVSVDSVTVNNGSDALIHQVMRTFLAPGSAALSCRGGFISFGIAVKTMGAEPRYVPLTSDYRFDVEAIANAITDDVRIVYIPNPNNPTGTHITVDELDYLLERIPDDRLLVMDEAYHHYASQAAPDTFPDSITRRHPNVLTLRTFSKSYGLAAFRIGYAVGHPEVVKWLLKTKLPFDPNAIGCAAAIGALTDEHHLEKTVAANHDGLRLLTSTLRELGYTTTDSIANFVMVDLGDEDSASQFHRALLEHGFISRPLSGFDLPGCVRITTGTPEQNQRLASTLKLLAEQFVTT